MISRRDFLVILILSTGIMTEDDPCLLEGCTCTLNKGLTDVSCRSLAITVMPNLANVTGKYSSIDLSRNRIKSIPTLHEIDGLKDLNLSRNVINEITPNALKDFVYLENLDLSYNQITNLSNILPLSGLRYFNLSHNIVRDIPMGIFHSITELRELKLSGNPLHYVRFDMFRELSKVIVLDLSSCALSTLPDDVFHTMIALEELDLSRNHFESVPSTGLRSTTKLKSLKLNGNQIHTIESNAFSKIKHLEILELSDMGTLTVIQPEAFSGLKLLKVLRIARNPHLKLLDFQAFHGLYLVDDDSWTLQELSLRENGLEEIISPSTTLCRIHTLDLQGNPWNCDCDLIWTTSCELRDELTSELKCSSPVGMNGKEISKLGAEDMKCLPNEDLEHHRNVLRVVVISSGLVGLVFCVAVIIVIVKKRKIMEWWYYRKRGSGAVYYAKAKMNSQDP